MIDGPINPSNLTKEKSLLALYFLSFKFPYSPFNVISTLAIAGTITICVFLGEPTHGEIASTLRETIKLGISLVPSILGFLIAGFTVFVTVTKSAIFVHMARLQYESTGESYLKYNLSAFILAFAHYIAYLAVCVLMTYFGQPNGPLTQLLKLASRLVNPTRAPDVHAFFIAGALIIFGAWTWYLVMLLKSFVYNTYQVVTTTVRWELETQESENK